MTATGPGEAWTAERGDSPIIATAIHAGHEVRPEVAALLALTDEDRLREEDPFTDRWTQVAPTRLIAHRSRFEVDLNRPRERAVYLVPEDAFGLEVWRQPPPDRLVNDSLDVYDRFYAELGAVCDAATAAFGRFVVLDIHSYNHRRSGPDAPVDDPDKNPEINVGTGSLDRDRWGGLVDRFIQDVAAAPFDGGHLDVRENVRFQGGHMSRWVHAKYPMSGCVLAVEVKKIFMDEWSGQADEAAMASLMDVFRATVPGLLEELEALG